jgi:drug/metabolite transporter (DMT)-like permease
MTSEPQTGKSPRPSAAKIAVNFALVYVLWGSTYLGIRISDESIRPLALGSVRFATAGVLLLAWCWFARRRVTISAPDALRLAIIGILLLTGGNTTLAWAELSVPSGLAALIVAITPLWVMILDWLFYRERLSARGLFGIGLGIVGIAVLLWPQLAIGGAVGRRELVGAASLLFGSASWALGSVLSRHWKLGVDPLVASGYEMTFSGVFNTVLALLFGSFAGSTWAPRSVGAVAYLIVFGSWIGFSAYIWLLGHVPTSKVATYAYVNPLVAVLLGWALLSEQLSLGTLAGAALIVASVAVIVRREAARPAPRPEPAPLLDDLRCIKQPAVVD